MAIADFVVKHGATVNEIATFTSQTEATSTSNAALIVAGGVGIAKKLIVASTISGTQLISTIATGTAPFSVTSTTTVANLTAATVATNANLTGPITSTGNATAIASQTGTGSKFVMDTSPTLVTPALGVATATSINGLTISSSTGTLSIANTKTFAVNNTITLAGTDSTTITLPATTGTVALNNQIHYIGTTSIAINRASLAQTLTGVSIDGNAATVTTNANLTGVITSTGNATVIASQTGTGSKFVVDTSPTLVTPILGVATATSINKVAISTIGTTNNASIVIGDTKTLTVNNTLTFNGTDASSVAFGTGGTVVYASSGLSQFTSASTTSAQLATVISDETGSGLLVFGTSPNIITSLTTTSTSFDLINANATTVNFAKAATVLSIGATTGTTTINNDLTVSGALTVNGTITTVNSTTVTVDDKNLELGSVTTPTDVTADGGGITLKAAADKTFQWASASNTWVSNIGLTAATSLVSSSASFNLINTTATTINFAGAATTLAIGVAGTATTLNGSVNLPNVGTSGFVKLGASGALSADTNSYALTNQTMYIGTTAININRASGALTLTGITSIDGALASQGAVANNTTGTGLAPGLSHAQVYNNGYPTSYGNVMTMYGTGASQLLLGWSGTTGATADNYIRSLRDSAVGTNGWSTWDKILTSANYNTYSPTLTGTGASGNWGINITGTATGLSSSPTVTGKLTLDYAQAVGIGAIGQYDAVYGSSTSWYNAGFRNDGGNVYLLSSNVQTTQALAKAASWNTYRPLSWNLSTGILSLCASGQSINIAGGTGSSQVNIASSNAYGGAGYAGFFTLTNTNAGATNTNKYIRTNIAGGLEVINNAYNAVIFAISDAGNVNISGSFNGSGAGISTNTIPVASISATGTKDSTTYLAGDGTWKSTLLEPTYTPSITGSGAITLTIDFATVNSTTILIPLPTGITGATITFTNLSSKAISNTVFSYNVVLSHVSALSATTSIVWKFGSALNPKWTGNIIPPSTVTAGAIDIWSFFTYDAGASLVGSLSMADVRNA
jgi:hypothetical protein